MMLSDAQVKKHNKAALLALLTWVGNKNRLAKQLGVSAQTVHGWVKRGRISATSAKIVEEKTAGLFTKEYLRCDVEDWTE